MMRYCAARFERGSGLGNRLYPWARCHTHALKHDLPMLAPHWWWPPRVRPLLKEVPPIADLAGHLYVRGMRALPEYVSGARRTWIEATARANVLAFRGDAGRFTALHDHEQTLRHALERICVVPPPADSAYIGLHVRRGDFSATARTQNSWFVTALRAVRAHLGSNVLAKLVSDGAASELRDLLAEPNVSLVRTRVPLADLLILARARVLLASGSSFSAWAAFLGGMPAVTHPAHSLAWYGVKPRSFLGHFNPDHKNADFLNAAVAAF